MFLHAGRGPTIYAASPKYVAPAVYATPPTFAVPTQYMGPSISTGPMMAYTAPLRYPAVVQCSPRVSDPVQHSVPSEASAEELRACDALLKCQEEHLEEIMLELKTNGYKRGHWIWYVFPTEKAGNADFAQTYVTSATVSRVCGNMATAKSWQGVLECICDLVEANGMRVFPRIDHGRIHWFLKFWMSVQGKPTWMHRVCQRLDQFKWPPC